ncbi:MAG: spermidine synthase [Planctomycetota bacterium]|nr:spermidine synthase [Planctomycetota bacterium]
MAAKLEILAHEETPLGLLCLRRRELLSMPGTIVTEVTLNHEFLMSSYHTDSEQALARFGVEMHGGQDLKVLIGGLGLGYTADATLQFPQVQSVEVIELLAQVIGWLEDGLLPLSETLLADQRLAVMEGDGYAKMWNQPESAYDLILIDIDHSPDDRLGAVDASFYSVEGLEKARHHLSPGGVLGIWSYEESDPFAAAMGAVFDETRVEPVTHENVLIDQTQTDWLYFGRNQ